MKIEFEIDDQLFEAPFKDAVSRRVAEIVKRMADEKIDRYRSKIEQAVELYLAKRLTNRDIENEIEKAVRVIIEHRLEND